MGKLDFHIIDEMPTGVFLIDKNYQIIFWNKCMEGWTGLSKSKIEGSSLKKLAPLFNNKRITTRIDTLFEGGPPVVLSSRLHKQIIPAKKWDGTDMLQHTTASSSKSPDEETLALFVIQDVTELSNYIKSYSEMKSIADSELSRRREAEEKLKILSLVVEQNPAYIFITDSKGVIEYVNPAFESTLGYSSDECIGKTPNLFKSGEHEDIFYSNLWETLKSGNIWSGDICNKRKDGSLFWSLQVISPIIESSGNVTHYVSVEIDDSKRKETEEALKDSDNKLRLIMDSTAEAIYGIDLEGRCTFANPSTVKLLGFANTRDLLGQNMHDLIHHTKNDGTKYPVKECSIYKAFRENVNCHSIGEYLWKKDGTGFPSELWSYPIWDDGKVTGAVVSFIDITERLKSESALEESKERLVLAQNIAKLGTWDWNIITGDILWSDDMFAILDIEKEGVVPTYELFINKVHSEDRENVNEAVEHSLDFKEPYNVKHRVVLDSGEIKYIHETGRVYYEDGEPVRMIGVAQDTTDSEIAAEALRTSERELRKAQEIAKIGNWRWNMVTDEYVCFKEACNIYGMDKTECKATFEDFLEMLVHPDDRLKVRVAADKSKESGDKFNLDFRIIDLDSGEEKIVHSQAEIIVDKEGFPINMLGTVQDITERKKTEEELHKGQKLESLGVLAGGIAHDFNNLLTIILGNISVTLSDIKEGDKSFKALTESLKASRRAGELTGQLLSFAKGNKPIKKIINFKELINESVSLVLSGTNATCETNISDNLSNINVDPGQISQVINNVLINGVQAMSKGGRITVIAKDIFIDDDGDIDNGDYVSLSISDEGIGMSDVVIKKIFDPYFTTKNSGNGLGLASSYSIIKNHGGTIRVESIEGKGTTFTILIPAGVGDVIKAVDNSKEVVAGKGATILVMDDDESIAELIDLILSKHGFKVTTVGTGEDAILAYKEKLKQNNPFDAVVMDLTIRGGMGGKDTIEILKKLDPNICAIVSSGYSNDAIMADYKRFGFSGSVSKPYNSEDLVKMLSDVLENKKTTKV